MEEANFSQRWWVLFSWSGSVAHHQSWGLEPRWDGKWRASPFGSTLSQSWRDQCRHYCRQSPDPSTCHHSLMGQQETAETTNSNIACKMSFFNCYWGNYYGFIVETVEIWSVWNQIDEVISSHQDSQEAVWKSNHKDDMNDSCSVHDTVSWFPYQPT